MVQSIYLLTASPVTKVFFGIREAHLKAKHGRIAYQVHNLCDYLTLGLHSAWLIQQLKISFLCSVTYWKQEAASSSMVRLKGDVTNINILT